MAQICYKNLKFFSWYFLCANIFVCVVIFFCLSTWICLWKWRQKKKTKHELEIFFYWTQYSKIVTGSSIYGYIKRKITWALARKTEKTPLAWGLNCSLVTLQTRTRDTWREWNMRIKEPKQCFDTRHPPETKITGSWWKENFDCMTWGQMHKDSHGWDLGSSHIDLVIRISGHRFHASPRHWQRILMNLNPGDY